MLADDAALDLLAEAGDGSMRDALSIMDQAIASAPTEDGIARLDAAQIRELMGTVPNAVFERILEAVNANQSAEVVTIANQLLDSGNSPAQLARQCVRYLRNCVIAKISNLNPDGSNLDGPSRRAPANLPRRTAPRRPLRRPLFRRRTHPLPADHAPYLRRTRLQAGTTLPF